MATALYRKSNPLPLNSESLPKVQVPAGIWMLSLGPKASQQGDCLPVV